MGFRKKILIGSLVLTSLVSGALGYLNQRQDVVDYIVFDRAMNRRLVQDMGEQEKILGIKYSGKPKLKYYIPEKLGIARNLYCGYFDYEKNWLHYNIERTDCDIHSTFRHELGHFYLHSNCKKENGNCYKYLNSVGDNEFKMAIFNMIEEGMAEYFDRKISKKPDNFEDEEYFQDWDRWGTDIFYEGGYHLVKPIIDEFGKDGIDYLIANFPEEEELFRLPGYRERIREELTDR